MGKCYARLKRLDQLPLDAIGALIASVPVDAYIAVHEAGRDAARADRQSV